MEEVKWQTYDILSRQASAGMPRYPSTSHGIGSEGAVVLNRAIYPGWSIRAANQVSVPR